MLKTAIVILNWNGMDWLQKFLETTIKHSISSDTRIYIADNGSTDGSQEWAAGNPGITEIIQLEKNYGFAGGYNRALSRIDARYFVLLNSSDHA